MFRLEGETRDNNLLAQVPWRKRQQAKCPTCTRHPALVDFKHYYRLPMGSAKWSQIEATSLFRESGLRGWAEATVQPWTEFDRVGASAVADGGAWYTGGVG